MQNISELLKEAKPLYFQRKRQIKCAKIICSILLPVFVFSSFVGVNVYEKCNLISLSSGSAISEMGLPTDEYGLLKVN